MSDLWAMITGANRGIGLALMNHFSKNGYNIIFHSRTHDNKTKKILEDLKKQFEIKIIEIYFDLREIPTEETLRDKIIDHGINHLDVLVNNAGIYNAKMIQLTSENEMVDLFNINLFSIYKLTKIMLPFLRKSSQPSIINISSISSTDLNMGEGMYGVSKSSVNSLTIILHKELSMYGIRVNAVAPGIVKTDLLNDIGEQSVNKALNLRIRKYPIEPCEIAEVVYFLASPRSTAINGEIIRCDGGRL